MSTLHDGYQITLLSSTRHSVCFSRGFSCNLSLQFSVLVKVSLTNINLVKMLQIYMTSKSHVSTVK